MSTARAHPATALALIFALATVLLPVAWSGVDLSMTDELERLEELSTLLEDIEAANSDEDLEDLRARWSQLQRTLDRVREGQGSESQQARQIDDLGQALADLSEDVENLRDEVTRYFPKARNRVAVFTLDDPDGLGLGDDLSFLISKQLLFATRTQSFAVVNFQQGAQPEAVGELGYFDKVERLTRGQDYALAMWGRIAKARDGVRVSLFAQAFPRLDEQPRFAHRVAMSTRQGEQWLTAELTHDRFELLDVVLPEGLIDRLPLIVEEIRTLRSNPRLRADAVGALTDQAPHYIVDSRRDWVRLRVRGGATGWTSVRAPCADSCNALIDAVAFANEVVAAGAGLRPRAPAASLSSQTELVFEELTALRALARKDYGEVKAVAARSPASPRQAAGLANMVAVAEIAQRSGAQRPVEVSTLIAQADSLRGISAFTTDAGRNLRVIAEAVPEDDAASQRWKANTERQAFLTQRKWALVIGVNDYAHVPAYKHGAEDARRVAKVFRESGYRTDLLIDPTREEVRAGVRAHARDAEVVIFAAGHLRVVDGEAALLLGRYDPSAPSAANAVSLDTLAAGEGQRTLMLDAPLGPALRDGLPRGTSDLLVNVTTADAPPVEIGAGPFAYFLSRSLRTQGGQDGLLTLSDLAARMAADAARFGVQLETLALRGSGGGIATTLIATPPSTRPVDTLRREGSE